ncbi:MAG: shikimate dehydrogenase [Gemmatimonadota bacterium]
MTVTSRTRVYALLGDPVAHSSSPVMQNAAFRAAGKDAVYVALRSDELGFAPLLRGIALAGGGGNVTLPHKERAARVIDEATEDVRRTGACNTFWLQDGRVHGDNTDVEGFRRALDLAFPGSRVGWRVLLLGAGGAARAVLVALLDEGVEHVTLHNRTVERARSVARRIGGERVRVAESAESFSGDRFDLVVNSTSLGLRPSDALPLSIRQLREVGAVIDLLYGTETPLVAEARGAGIPVADGRGMLLHQGAVAFERWWSEPAPLEAMDDALPG